MSCYRIRDNLLYNQTGSEVPCGNSSGVRQCCWAGDTCLEDFICHYTHPLAGGSGYYISSCTDETYRDKACSHICTDNKWPDIVYNYNTFLWACCSIVNGTDVKDCSHPLNETFQAPEPQALVAAAATAVSSTPTPVSSNPSNTALALASPSSSTTTTAAAAAAAAATSAPAQPSTLSTGAIAGIVVATLALLALAALALAFRLLLRRRRRQHAADAAAAPRLAYAPPPELPSAGRPEKHRLGGGRRGAELDGANGRVGVVHELGGEGGEVRGR